MFAGRGVLKKSCSENMQIFSKQHLRQSAISVKFQSNFIEITLRSRFAPINLLHTSEQEHLWITISEYEFLHVYVQIN